MSREILSVSFLQQFQCKFFWKIFRGMGKLNAPSQTPAPYPLDNVATWSASHSASRPFVSIMWA